MTYGDLLAKLEEFEKTLPEHPRGYVAHLLGALILHLEDLGYTQFEDTPLDGKADEVTVKICEAILAG